MAVFRTGGEELLPENQKYFGAFVIRGLSGIFAGYSQPASGKYIGLNQSTSLGIIDNDF